MFERLSVRDKWTYVALAALLIFGLAWTLARKFHPVGPAEIHAIPESALPSKPESATSTPKLAPSEETNNERETGSRNEPGPQTETQAAQPTPRTNQPEDTPKPPTSNDQVPNLPDQTQSDSNPDSNPVSQSGLDWLNSANVDQLLDLPGVGPALAQHIIDYREKNGPFANVDDLANVGGIGEKRLAKIKAYLATK